MAARFDMDVLERDPEFHSMAVNMWLNFARGLVKDGMYAAWFGTSVNMGCGIVERRAGARTRRGPVRAPHGRAPRTPRVSGRARSADHGCEPSAPRW